MPKMRKPSSNGDLSLMILNVILGKTRKLVSLVKDLINCWRWNLECLRISLIVGVVVTRLLGYPMFDTTNWQRKLFYMSVGLFYLALIVIIISTQIFLA